jgi:hypothetical protein
MDAFDRILQDDLNRLLDRLAAGSSPGAVLQGSAERPDLCARAEALEADIASGRAALLLHYGRWRESLEELADLWSLIARQRRERPDDDAERLADSLRAA